MKKWTFAAAGLLTFVAVVGCTSKPGGSPQAKSGKPSAAKDGDEHHDGHAPGPHGGVVFDFGRVHGEFVTDPAKQECSVYIFGSDEKTPKSVAATHLDLTIKNPAMTLELKPAPATGDPAGKASRFFGQHAEFGKKQRFVGVLAGVVDNKPSQGEFDTDTAKHAAMPKGVGGTPAERDLFLTPGGIYSAADIAANGSILPSKKFAGISWPHDDVQAGDKICPVTANKADSRCQWIVNGKSYEFCCTPCLDKFVKWAKTQPDRIKEPTEYIQK